jgi:hypothetical protein
VNYLRPSLGLLTLRREDQGKVDVRVGTTRIRKLSCFQDVIVPQSEEKYL